MKKPVSNRGSITACVIRSKFILGIVALVGCATIATADVAPIKSPAARAAAVKAAEEKAVADKEAAIAAAKAGEEGPKEDDGADDVITKKNKVIRGSRATLKGEMSLSDALASLEEQTDNRLVDYRGRLDQPRLDPTIELDLEDVSYWTAVESILEKAELTLYPSTNIPNTLGLAARPESLTTNPPVSTSDLFRVQVIHLNANRDLRDEGAELNALVEVTWEPRTNPLVIHQAPEDLEAIGDDGEALELNAEYGVGNSQVLEGIGAVEMTLPFHLPPRTMQTIATLKGTMRAQIPTEHRKFVFKDLENAKDVVKRAESISVVLTSVKKNRQLYDFRIILKLDGAANELKMQQGWIYGNTAYLIDPDGKRVEYAGLEMYRSTQEEVGLGYKFEAKQGLKGYQFIYESPSDITTVPVKYELKGIELP